MNGNEFQIWLDGSTAVPWPVALAFFGGGALFILRMLTATHTFQKTGRKTVGIGGSLLWALAIVGLFLFIVIGGGQ